MKEIKEELYQMKVGPEVYSIRYPSLEESEGIQKELEELQGKYNIEVQEEAKELNKVVTQFMKDKMVELGLAEKFYSLKQVQAKHIFEAWKEINSLAK